MDLRPRRWRASTAPLSATRLSTPDRVAELATGGWRYGCDDVAAPAGVEGQHVNQSGRGGFASGAVFRMAITRSRPTSSQTRPAPTCGSSSRTKLRSPAPNDGARWELRSSFTKGYNVLTLRHYIVEPRLDDEAAVTDFIAGKDRDHSGLAGFRVTHTERASTDARAMSGTTAAATATGTTRRGSRSRSTACASNASQQDRRAGSKCLCAEAIGSLEFD
jgi:hypothetical protein